MPGASKDSTTVLQEKHAMSALGTITYKIMEPLGRCLHGKHMEPLGLRNTMRMAKAFNRRAHRKYEEYRRSQYKTEFEELVRDNGAPSGPVHAMREGLALDTPMQLPHLREMLEAADGIVAKRRLVQKRPGARRGRISKISSKTRTWKPVRRFWTLCFLPMCCRRSAIISRPSRSCRSRFRPVSAWPNQTPGTTARPRVFSRRASSIIWTITTGPWRMVLDRRFLG